MSRKRGASLKSGGSGSGSASSATKQDSKGPLPFRGYTFCITGTMSVPRAQFTQLLIENGASIAVSVTAKVTHLIAADGEEGTSKYIQAQQKKIPIVSQDWIYQALGDKPSGSASSSSSSSVSAGHVSQISGANHEGDDPP